MRVIEAEKVPFVPGGVEAIVFTADGDMRCGGKRYACAPSDPVLTTAIRLVWVMA